MAPPLPNGSEEPVALDSPYDMFDSHPEVVQHLEHERRKRGREGQTRDGGEVGQRKEGQHLVAQLLGGRHLPPARGDAERLADVRLVAHHWLTVEVVFVNRAVVNAALVPAAEPRNAA